MLSKAFNETLCVDHFYLNQVCLIHFMDIARRFSVASIVDNNNISTEIQKFEELWVLLFWYPENIKRDSAFDGKEFKKHINDTSIQF